MNENGSVRTEQKVDDELISSKISTMLQMKNHPGNYYFYKFLQIADF